VQASKLCTDHDIKPFICGLVMYILLVVVCRVISVLLSYSSAIRRDNRDITSLNGETEQSDDLIEIFLLAAATA